MTPTPLQILEQSVTEKIAARQALYQESIVSVASQRASDMMAWYQMVVPESVLDLFTADPFVICVPYRKWEKGPVAIESSYVRLSLKGQPDGHEVVLTMAIHGDSGRVEPESHNFQQSALGFALHAQMSTSLIFAEFARCVVGVVANREANRKWNEDNAEKEKRDLKTRSQWATHRSVEDDAEQLAREMCVAQAREALTAKANEWKDLHGWPANGTLSLWKIEWGIGPKEEGEICIASHYADDHQPDRQGLWRTITPEGVRMVLLQPVHGYQATQISVRSIEELPEYWMREAFWASHQVDVKVEIACDCGLPDCNGTVQVHRHDHVTTDELDIRVEGVPLQLAFWVRRPGQE